jgi:hypothetical protein
MTVAAQQRRDLHNISVDSSLAAEGLCGLTHLPTGRVCRLPYLHAGPCDLRPRLTGADASDQPITDSSLSRHLQTRRSPDDEDAPRGPGTCAQQPRPQAS